MKDYYKSLTVRSASSVPDGAGDFIVTYLTKSFKGFIVYFNATERYVNDRVGSVVTARLFTDEQLRRDDLIEDNDRLFRIVESFYYYIGGYFHRYYDLIEVVDES